MAAISADFLTFLILSSPFLRLTGGCHSSLAPQCCAERFTPKAALRASLFALPRNDNIF